jgi:DNA-binding GntR family transcriptional regulator
MSDSKIQLVTGDGSGRLHNRDPFPIHREDHASQADKAYHGIRRLILRCELPPGSVLNDRVLMARLEIGRTPIREALLRLSFEGLVQFLAGQTIIVAPVGVDQIKEHFVIRLHLERLAWQLWLSRSGDTEIARLCASFDGADASLANADWECLKNLDFRFHSNVMRNCGNKLLADQYHSLSGFSYRLWFLREDEDVMSFSNMVKSHDPILKAVVDGDAGAVDREVTAHIAHTFERTIQRLKGTEFAIAAEMPAADLSMAGD